MHTLQIGKYTLGSRLIVGSGKYDSFETTKAATLASGSELITVAVRRLNITNPNEPNLRDTFARLELSDVGADGFVMADAVMFARIGDLPGQWLSVRIAASQSAETSIHSGENRMVSGGSAVLFTRSATGGRISKWSRSTTCPSRCGRARSWA